MDYITTLNILPLATTSSSLVLWAKFILYVFVSLSDSVERNKHRPLRIFSNHEATCLFFLPNVFFNVYLGMSGVNLLCLTVIT